VIHRAARAGFARSADAYERSRPGYPDEAIRHLVSHLTAGARVLDLAAGTGKLTRPLLASGLDVVAVEPVPDMRAGLPARVRVLDGTAEAVPLADGSVDAVTVGQAFHWFDGERALDEIHRVLRPKGMLGLIWNRRVEEDPVNRRISELLAPYRGDAPTHRLDAWRSAFARTALFEPLEEHVFANQQVLDAQALEGRIGSISFIAALVRDERARVLERARSLAGEGTVVVPYRCELQVCRAR
jgi:ubiquinone/menaquinone biosynthesis C-methylase UbiE